MAQETLVRLKCEACKRMNYWTTRNRKTIEKPLELKKFCKQCETHTKHKEGKKKS